MLQNLQDLCPAGGLVLGVFLKTRKCTFLKIFFMLVFFLGELLGALLAWKMHRVHAKEMGKGKGVGIRTGDVEMVVLGKGKGRTD